MAGLSNCSHALSYGRRMLLALAGSVLLLSAPWPVLAAGAPAAAPDSKSELKTIVIPVEGMSCVACAATVKKAIKSLVGVSDVEVSLEKRSARVTYASDKLSPDSIVDAIDKAGYKAGSPREAE